MKSVNRLGLLAISTILLALGQAAQAEEPQAGPASSVAQSKSMNPEERAIKQEEMRKRMESMSPEQREAMKQKFRERQQKMSPEEREAKREEMRKRMENMSPEQREAMKQRFREHRLNAGGAGKS